MKSQYTVYYPKIAHPLAKEKLDLKVKYVCLLKHYYELVCANDFPTKVRIERFAYDFIPSPSVSPIEFDVAAKSVTKFKIFSYRYIFLFDCIFILAGDDKQKAACIADKMKETIHKRYHKKIDLLIDRMYQDNSKWSDFPQITLEMQEAWNTYLEYINTSEKSVIFTATMSAGKSTLINALIGREITNTKKAACTATVMEFVASPFYHTLYHVLDEKNSRYNVQSPFPL